MEGAGEGRGSHSNASRLAGLGAPGVVLGKPQMAFLSSFPQFWEVATVIILHLWMRKRAYAARD